MDMTHEVNLKINSMEECQTYLSDLRRAFDKSSGRRDVLREREAELIEQVGRAKGRLEMKPKVDAFLAELQAEANERAVGAYARLLTSLVGDVLGTHAGTVELDLYTAQGLPALDVYVRTAKGKRVSVLNHSAGSFINLVSLGLRATSTVRSGKRKFIALDEPDCWTRPSRVRAFYSVITQLAKELNIQFLVVSHNDPSLLPEDISITKLRLTAEGTIGVENDPDAKQWTDEDEGIRYIRMTNFRNHKDTTVPLSPGVTAIVGDNSIGKSAVLHAFRCLCYGDVVDGDICDDAEEQKLEVEIGIESGNTIALTRSPKRNPVNEWSMHDSMGELIYDQDSGHPLKRGGRTPPDFVSHFGGVERMENLDVQLSHQLFPVFLLGETPSKRASVLSIGREAGHIGAMIALQKTRCQQDSSLIKKGEQELSDIREKLDILKDIDKASEKLAECETLYKTTEAIIRDLSLMDVHLRNFDNAELRLKDSQEILSVFSSLPVEEDVASMRDNVTISKEIGEFLTRWDRANTRMVQGQAIDKAYASLPDEAPTLIEVDEMRRLGRRYGILSGKADKLTKLLSSFDALPQDVPELINLDPFRDSLVRMKKLESKQQEAEKRVLSIEQTLSTTKKEIDDVLSQLGNLCPTCGSSVESAMHIVEHHAFSE